MVKQSTLELRSIERDGVMPMPQALPTELSTEHYVLYPGGEFWERSAALRRLREQPTLKIDDVPPLWQAELYNELPYMPPLTGVEAEYVLQYYTGVVGDIGRSTLQLMNLLKDNSWLNRRKNLHYSKLLLSGLEAQYEYLKQL